jgi:hypothetical protein
MHHRHAFPMPRLLCIALSLCAGAVVSSQSFAQTSTARECLTPAGSVSLAGVEGRLDHLAVDPATKRLFVAALENHTIEVVDLTKRQRVHQISLVREPQGLAFIPGASRLLACSRGEAPAEVSTPTPLRKVLGLTWAGTPTTSGSTPATTWSWSDPAASPAPA